MISHPIHFGRRKFRHLALLLLLCGVSPGHTRETEPPAKTRIALLGCLKQDRPAPALPKYLAAGPDICLWVGDNVYADTEDDPEFIRECYRTLEALPGFRELRDEVPFVVTWDDHDYGLNNLGEHYVLKDESKAIFREFWKMEEFIPEDRDGVYHERRFPGGADGLQILLLDPRYNRDDEGPESDTLGENQWKWLEERLREPASLRLIVSGFQILSPADHSWESWAKFPAAKKRLFQTVRTSGAENVVFITGDQHYGEVLRLGGALDVDAVEIMYAGVNQIEPPEPTDRRVSVVNTSVDSIGLLDIQWADSETETAHLHFLVLNAETGEREVTYRLNFSEIRFDIGFGGRDRFLDKSEVLLTAPPAGDWTIRYTTDGSDPGPASPEYSGPIKIHDSCEIRAALFAPEGFRRTAVKRHLYEKLEAEAAVTPDGELEPGLRFDYREGGFKTLDDMIAVPATHSGRARSLDPAAIAMREDQYGIVFSGFLKIPKSGLYDFTLRSDDGSRLFVHGEKRIDLDGSHAATSRTSTLALAAGLHPIRIDYFEDHADQELSVEIRAVGGEVIPLVVYDTGVGQVD